MNRFAVFALLPVAATLAACSAPTAGRISDDPDNITVHCNKSALRWNTCYEAAARLCGEKGYQVVGDDGGNTPSVTTNAYEVPVIGGAMVIRCNP